VMISARSEPPASSTAMRQHAARECPTTVRPKKDQAAPFAQALGMAGLSMLRR
jgi:hypothetical protein